MHPMFVKLYLEPDTDDDQRDKRRARRTRRPQSRTAVRAPVRDRDRPPRR